MSACIEYCNTLQHTATHCNTLQRTATHCNTLQRTTTHYIILYNTANTFNALKIMSSACIEYINTSDIGHMGCAHTLTHTQSHTHTHTLESIHIQYMQVCMCWFALNILAVLHHSATHCNALQHTATHCNALQRTATHCNTLQHTTTFFGIRLIRSMRRR